MTVVLKDIDVNKRRLNKNDKISDAELYTLNEYRTIAKKCISLFSGPTFRALMIKDEDAIAHVAEHIVWGHIRWKEDGGRTLKSYLNQCAIWAIKVWKTKIYNSYSKNKIVSLNQSMGDSSAESESSNQIYQITEDKKCSEPFDILFNDSLERVKKIIKSETLTKIQSRCLYERYVEGKKLRQIASSLKVSRQAVNQHIKKAINKLRKHHGICD